MSTHLESRAEAFWNSLDKTSSPKGCWLWTGRLDPDGYGRAHGERTHRIALRLSGREIPAGHVTRHECDNRACCNPSHLLTGTHTDNAADRDQRGRNGKAKLSPDDVKVIRRLFYIDSLTNRQIADLTGVCVTTVHNITAGRTWRWVLVSMRDKSPLKNGLLETKLRQSVLDAYGAPAK